MGGAPSAGIAGTLAPTETTARPWHLACSKEPWCRKDGSGLDPTKTAVVPPLEESGMTSRPDLPKRGLKRWVAIGLDRAVRGFLMLWFLAAAMVVASFVMPPRDQLRRSQSSRC